MRPALRVFLASALLCLGVPVFAQAISTKIYFTGAAPYSDADLSTVLGLQSGQLFNDNEVQLASQRLVDTGLFDSVAMTGTGQGRTRQIRFTLKPTPDAQLLPASFSNFVWFTPAEIDAALHSRVPLYRGLLSDSGNLADAVEAVLTAMLKDKGVTATVSHTIVEPTTDHPIRCVSFSIEAPELHTANAHLSISGPPGVAAQLAPFVRNALPHVIGSNYKEGLVGPTVQDLLLAPIRNAGYVTATLDITARTPTPADYGYAIDCTAHITTGDPYKLAAPTWSATPVYSAADFARDDALHSGDLATLNALHKAEAPILAAYSAQGYMDAYLRVTPTLDTTAHTVAYNIAAMPGAQYHLKSITVTGLPPDARQDFDSGWRMKPGDLYNEPYIQHFLHNNTSLLKLNNYAGTYQASADPNTHLVDLSITFVSKTQPQ